MARTILVQILGDASSLEREFKKAGNSADTFGKRLGLSGKTLLKGGAIAGGAAVIAGVSKQLVSSVKAARDAEAASIRLAGAFDQARVAAKDRERAQDSINRVSRQAALDDEDLSDVLAKLTRTTGSVQKGLKGMALAANIARARNIPLAAAAKIVEKAHVGQLRGLKSVGVQIDKNTSTTEALEKAQRQFAGSAERYGNSAAGAQDKLSVAFENLQERVGQKLLPVLQRLALKLVDLIDWSEKNWPKFSKAISTAVAVVRPVIRSLLKAIQGIANVVAGVVKTIRAIARGDWSAAWDGLKQVAVDGLLSIVKAATELPRKILTALGSAAWRGLERIGTTIKNAALGGLKGLSNGVVNALKRAIQAMIDVVNGAVKRFNKVLGKVGLDLPKIPDIVQKSTAKAAGKPNPTTPPIAGLPNRPTAPGRVPTIQFPGGTFTPQPVRQESSVQPAQVNLIVDGQVLGTVTLRRNQRRASSSATPRRGPFAGINTGLG